MFTGKYTVSYVIIFRPHFILNLNDFLKAFWRNQTTLDPIDFHCLDKKINKKKIFGLERHEGLNDDIILF